MGAAEPVIELRGLRRDFTRRSGRGLRRSNVTTTAVGGITLDVAEAEIVGWLGPNGAGKSTTIKMCTGILVPTGGTVRVCGLDPVARRTALARRIGVVFGQRSQLWWDLPLRDSFGLLHRIHDTDPDDHQRHLGELVELLDIASTLDVPVRQLSLGQRMRGEIVAALLHRPQVLFLDEPTIGLDIVSTHALREALLVLRREHRVTIVLTTHDLGDVRRLCDRVTVIDHGAVVLDTTLDGLLGRAGARRRVVATFDASAGTDRIAASLDLAGVAVVLREGERIELDVDASVSPIPAVVARLGELGPLLDLAVEEPDIERIVHGIYTGRTMEQPG